MDNEVSYSIHIAIGLMVVSIIISIIVLFASIGQVFGSRQVTNVADIQAETYATELVTSGDYGALPAASVFLLLEKNNAAIRSISGTPYGVIVNGVDDLTQLFDKKVRIKLTEANYMDLYDIVIEEE